MVPERTSAKDFGGSEDAFAMFCWMGCNSDNAGRFPSPLGLEGNCYVRTYSLQPSPDLPHSGGGSTLKLGNVRQVSMTTRPGSSPLRRRFNAIAKCPS